MIEPFSNYYLKQNGGITKSKKSKIGKKISIEFKKCKKKNSKCKLKDIIQKNI